MKSVFRLSLLLMISMAFFTSCKKSAPRQTRHIPKNAVFVAAINTQAITNKLAKSQATIENLFKSMSGSDTALNKGKEEWEAFKNSGVDLSENFYVSVVQTGGGMGMNAASSVVTGIGGLKDAGKLEAYIKKKNPAAEVKKEKEYSYVKLEGNSIVAWGDDLVMVMNNAGGGGQMQFDSTTGEYNFQPPVNAEGEMKANLASYFNLKEGESVASIPQFRELMDENADGSFWINSASSVENMPIPLPKVKELVENSFTAATITFEEGKVVMNSKSYTSDAMNEMLKKYTTQGVDLSMVERFPSNNINGFMSFAFNPELITSIVNHMELKAMADNQLSQALGGNYTVQDVVKAIKGDVAVIVSDFNVPGGDSATGAPGSNPMKVVINIPVGDKTQMNRLMDKLVEMGMMVKTATGYTASEAISRSGYQVVVDDKNIIAASDLETLTQYKSGTAKASINSEIMNSLKGKTAAFYMDIESVLNGFPNNQPTNSVMPKAKETFKDMVAYADNFNGKYTAGHMELRMKNTNENSLVSMLQFLSVAGQAGKIGFGNEQSIDTNAAVTPRIVE